MAEAAGAQPARAFRRPASKVLFRDVGRDYARGLVSRGFAPAGSIWIPAPTFRRPFAGDLYAPDPAWKPPRAL